MSRECPRCDGTLEQLLSESYGGHKGGRGRGDTERTVYKCDGCGAEGRRFVDGVEGTVTVSGVLR